MDFYFKNTERNFFLWKEAVSFLKPARDFNQGLLLQEHRSQFLPVERGCFISENS